MTRVEWHERNQQHLMMALEEVRALLHAVADISETADIEPVGEAVPPLELQQGGSEYSDGEHLAASALETLSEVFGLSAFERVVLLLCAGVELEATFAAACAAAHGDPLRTQPTFGLAMAIDARAHWSSMAPSSPLRRWRMIEVGKGDSLATSPLRIDERILHFLTGLSYLDEQLLGYVQSYGAQPTLGDMGSTALIPSHQKLVDQVAELWLQASAGDVPAVFLTGADAAVKRQIAAAAAAQVGLELCWMSAVALPSVAQDLELLTRLWQREAVLGRRALLIDGHGAAANADAGRLSWLDHFIDSTPGPLLVASRQRRRPRYRSAVVYEVAKPTLDEQRDLWQVGLGEQAAAVNGSVERLLAHFDLGAPMIHSVCHQALPESGDLELGERLWKSCRVQARPALDDLARRIEPVATWDDIVLSDTQQSTLREVALHVRQRSKVYDSWGFGAKSSRGLGINALFAGPSGTGKTMAAEVLANDLDLDLYHIDLSQVVSKYIGETEKNLGRVFDAAEEGGALLLFDEADALFGKRSEVKDSHDRYANIEVSYLLQRMEAYRGLAILTSNLKEALDRAFLRRIRFTVQFPFPSREQRAEIWKRIFPQQTPTENLDVDKLSRLGVAGGNIRNIALNAAFLAAEAGVPINMGYLLEAARTEYTKLEKPLTDREVQQWS